jgi:hypothetical protein
VHFAIAISSYSKCDDVGAGFTPFRRTGGDNPLPYTAKMGTTAIAPFRRGGVYPLLKGLDGETFEKRSLLL